MLRLLSALTVAAFALALAARAEDDKEEKVPLDKVPRAVMDAVKKRFPKAEVKGASKEAEDKKTVYEVTLKQDGKNIDVTVTPEGAITTIEKEIDRKDLPKAAAEALDGKYPNATYKTIEEVTKVKDGKETLEYYEALLVTADKKTLEVEVTPDGKIKNVEEKKGEKEEKKDK